MHVRLLVAVNGNSIAAIFRDSVVPRSPDETSGDRFDGGSTRGKEQKGRKVEGRKEREKEEQKAAG